ncbi:2OG-Fe(II) oxygenase [Psychromonas sp. SR45-3]|uniref:2OG-Fe(II) oxygenase n=1 Tax=Psychromonas sp. SR45-3 TaxID=2760930 RepID=UPI0015FB6E14|nr:2OG-Fe(II) oxygenase [Psychromonas sp. SR45-3]MBB1271911.1 2OG-Fe(II) oxygenase [Psychromonas sp. SR45-3]
MPYNLYIRYFLVNLLSIHIYIKATTLLAAKKIREIGRNKIIDESLFALIAKDIHQQGYSIRPTALPEHLTETLFIHQQAMEADKFKNAGIGRGKEYLKNEFVRTDAISWITGESQAGKEWLEWTASFQRYLNRHLFLGLFSFESHFAHYGPGDYYKRHYDAFKGESNRILSLVVYFNSHWLPTDGGELVLYKNDHDREGIKVVPLMGTVVAFLSEEFPHEVLAANRDRYSIAGWFRVNTSVTDRVDPPR